MKIFLDIGAWKGDVAQSVLSSKHDFDRIYCFEPQLDLCEEIRSIDNSKIIVQEFGLWNKSCEVNIYADANKGGRKNDGATVYGDRFTGLKNSIKVKMVKASDWFKNNLETGDYVVMKMNCEGSECDILDDLMDSGEFSKISALMVDFDVRKIPSQKHRESEVVERLKNYKIPVHFVNRYDQWNLRGLDCTHYWMDKIL